MKSVCLLAFIATFRLAISTQADTPAFSSGGYTATAPPSFTGTRGWGFFHLGFPSVNPIAITQLGVFDSGADGLVNPHQIGLWRADGTLLASATIPAGSLTPLVDGYRYVSISPVIIPTGLGNSFVVGAQYSAGDADGLVTPRIFQFASEVQAVPTPPRGRYGYGSDLPFPSMMTEAYSPEGSGGPTFWEANFQFVGVPEPSAILLLAPGLLYLFVRRRKHSAGETS